MAQLQIKPQYTQLYTVLLQRFKRYCQLYEITTFSADDFRLANLDCFFPNPPQQDVGAFFHWAVRTKKFRKLGHIPSINPRRNFAENKLYTWNKD